MVTVVGSGIIGLSSAIILQENGFKVTIISREDLDKTLSSKVGAVWFPFEIHPKEKANRWANLSYERYQLEAKHENGVSFIPFMTAYNSESNTEWTQTLPEGAVRKAKTSELPKGVKMAFISKVPLAEPPLYLPYLFKLFIQNGGSFKKHDIKDLDELSSLDSLVVNCTGLGAKKLCEDDELYPMRGQILRCKKIDIPCFADSTRKGALSYNLVRSEDCILGGTDYINDWNENPDEVDTQLILQRLKDVGLTSETPEILEEVVGLRPVRSEVRFEFDSAHPNVFHNYGHGGAGFTVAWGCAIELAEIIKNKISI